MIAFEGDVEDVTDGAAGAVAANDVLEGCLLGGAAGVLEFDVYGFAVLGEGDECDGTFDGDAKGGEVGGEDAFGLGLRDAELAVGEIGEVGVGVLRG